MQAQGAAGRSGGSQAAERFSTALTNELETAKLAPQTTAVASTNAATSASAAATQPAAASSTPSIAPLGTPNDLVQRGQLVEYGGGVYYNTANGTYQNLDGSVVGTAPASVQQYTDPLAFFQSGLAYEASDANLRATDPNIDSVAPPGTSPTVVLNSRWAQHDSAAGGPVLDSSGNPVYAYQPNPVPLMAYPGVLQAPGPPPLAGTIPSQWSSILDVQIDV